MRKNEFGVSEVEENFEEAVRAVNTALTIPGVNGNLRSILDHPSTNNITTEVRPPLSTLFSLSSAILYPRRAELTIYVKLKITYGYVCFIKVSV